MTIQPEIRFKGFTEDWESIKLGKYLKIPEKVPMVVSNVSDLLIISNNLRGIRICKQQTLDLGATKYFKRKKGQLLYGKQSFFKGSFSIIPDCFDGKATSADVPSLDITGCDSNYIYYKMSDKNFWKRTESLATGTASKRLHEKTLQEINIYSTEVREEQSLIGSFFKRLDEYITLLERHLQLFQELKKALLKQAFAEKHALIPEVRFKGFEEDWEETILKEITVVSRGRQPADDSEKDGNYLFYNTGKTPLKTNKPLFKEQDCVIVSGHGSVGNVHLASGDIGVSDGNYILNPKVLFSTEHLYLQSIKYLSKYLNIVKTGGIIAHTSVKDVENCKIKMSTDLKEQEDLGTLFKQLDMNISLFENKLLLTKDFKQTMLRKIFI